MKKKKIRILGKIGDIAQITDETINPCKGCIVWDDYGDKRKMPHPLKGVTQCENCVDRIDRIRKHEKDEDDEEE